jgi:hypothetical protein
MTDNMNPKTLCIIIYIIFETFGLKAQTDLKDNHLYCEQYSTIIDLISNDSIAKIEFPFKKFVFQIDDRISYGIGSPFMTRFYVGEILGISIEDLNLKDSVIAKLWAEVEKEDYSKTDLSELSLCLSKLQTKNRGFNIYLSFARKSDRIVFVNSSRIYNHSRHTNGVFYLFFFDDKNILHKVYRNTWIE